MISPRYINLPPWYGQCLSLGYKPVLSYSKPHVFSTFFGEEKKLWIYSLQPGPPEAEQNDRKVKRSKQGKPASCIYFK